MTMETLATPLVRRLPALLAGAAATVLVLALPLLLGTSDVFLAASIAINVLLALSMLLVLGYGGYFSLAQGALFGLGAYTVAILSVRSSLDLSVSLGAAMVAGALCGALIALSCMRTSELYLAMVTLAYGFVLSDVALNWSSLTGGGEGLSGFAPSLFGGPPSGQAIYWTAAGAGLVVLLVLATIRRNRIGRSIFMARRHRLAAECCGIPVRRSMVVTFAVGGALAACAGGLFVAYVGIADTTAFDFARTVTTLTFVVLAGVQALWSLAVVAAAFLYLQNLGSDAAWGNWLQFIYSALVIVVLTVAPGGIGGVGRAIARRVWGRGAGGRAAAPDPRAEEARA